MGGKKKVVCGETDGNKKILSGEKAPNFFICLAALSFFFVSAFYGEKGGGPTKK